MKMDGSTAAISTGTLTSSASLQAPKRELDMTCVSPRSRHLLLQKDVDPISWEYLKSIISDKSIEKLYRSPDVLYTYCKWKEMVKEQYGSTFRYVVIEKLGWLPPTHVIGTPIKVSPFKPNFMGSYKDIKILENDFPYYVEVGIRHLVIWFKCPIPIDQELDEITPDGYDKFNNFLNELFVKKIGIPRDSLLWFRNTAPLQSIKEIGHIHVMVKDSGNKHKNIIDDILGTSGLKDEDQGKSSLI